MLRTVVNKSRRALLRYVPPQVTRHLPAPLKGPKPIAGPPPGISIETLDSLCAEQLGGRIRRCAHQHVAAWKKHGTFRLYVVAENGTKNTFIFKDEIYTIDEIPALSGLPVRPGPPEYYVYKQSVDTPLSAFLPKLFWCTEIEPGRHFRYLLEDLRLTYRRLHFKPRDLLFAVRTLLEAQKAMNLTLARKDNHNLIRYDETFSERMLEYSRNNLQQYSRKTGDAEVADIVKSWSSILKCHKEDQIGGSELQQPIHGDYTLAHVHWKSGVNGVKIVDWEWAGIRVPHADLAALLRWANPELRKKAIEIMAAKHDQLSLEEHARLLRWCLLERNLYEAGFLAGQDITRHSVPRYFRRTVGELLAIVRGAR